MNFESLTHEQIEKAKACKTPEEILELTRAEGIELTDEDLAAIGGGVDRSGGDASLPKWG